MAKFETTVNGDFNEVVKRIEDGILNGSFTASLEETSDFYSGDARCSVRVFERYSYSGSNRVSLEWVKRIRTRFWDSISHSYFVKILANPSGFTAFLPYLSEKYLITKFSDLKWMRFRDILFVFDCRQAVAFQRQIGQKSRNLAI